jgi:hypothetical protein
VMLLAGAHHQNYQCREFFQGTEKTPGARLAAMKVPGGNSLYQQHLAGRRQGCEF